MSVSFITKLDVDGFYPGDIHTKYPSVPSRVLADVQEISHQGLAPVPSSLSQHSGQSHPNWCFQYLVRMQLLFSGRFCQNKPRLSFCLLSAEKMSDLSEEGKCFTHSVSDRWGWV